MIPEDKTKIIRKIVFWGLLGIEVVLLFEAVPLVALRAPVLRKIGSILGKIL